MTQLLDEALATRPTDVWLKHFAGAVPAAPVHDVAQALMSDFVTSENRVWSYAHRDGAFRMVPPAFRFPGETMPSKAAPELGRDTEALLSELGYDTERIAALRKAGAI